LTADKKIRAGIVMFKRLDPDLPSAPRGRIDEGVSVVPAELYQHIWIDYLELRREIGKPIKSVKEKFCIVRKLEQLQRQGHDPNAVLDEAILRSSSALLPLRQ
jgi:hypothetical protein